MDVRVLLELHSAADACIREPSLYMRKCMVTTFHHALLNFNHIHSCMLMRMRLITANEVDDPFPFRSCAMVLASCPGPFQRVTLKSWEWAWGQGYNDPARDFQILAYFRGVKGERLPALTVCPRYFGPGAAR